MSEQAAVPERRKFDWRGVWEKVVTAVITALFLGVGALIWNNYSNERVLKLFGGVSQAELEAATKRLGDDGWGRADPLANAVVAFDGQCPPGWLYFDEAVGSAIVGTGATLIGETGAPLTPSDYQKTTARQRAARPPDKPFSDFGPAGFGTPGTYADWGQTISRYLPNVKTALTPTYLPLAYCKRFPHFNDKQSQSQGRK